MHKLINACISSCSECPALRHDKGANRLFCKLTELEILIHPYEEFPDFCPFPDISSGELAVLYNSVNVQLLNSRKRIQELEEESDISKRWPLTFPLENQKNIADD